jgi:hypothetical protein
VDAASNVPSHMRSTDVISLHQDVRCAASQYRYTTPAKHTPGVELDFWCVTGIGSIKSMVSAPLETPSELLEQVDDKHFSTTMHLSPLTTIRTEHSSGCEILPD